MLPPLNLLNHLKPAAASIDYLWLSWFSAVWLNSLAAGNYRLPILGDKKSEGRLTSFNSASQTCVEFAVSFADTAPAVKTFFELSSPDVPLPGTVNTLFRARAVRQILTALNSASQRTRRREYSTPQTPQEFF